MTLDLSGAALLNAAGAFLFALVGAFILVVGRTTRLGWSVGTLSCAFGLLFVAENLLLADTLAGAVAWTLPAITAAGAGLVAAFHLAPGSPRERRVLVAYLVG
ncbi:MAG TPA: hypothetical protein VI997_01390, partial [Candidatus Thermoplasmatota archaeon]|nr:hypothetical protein [Candidatus Thermoplasmatota archaeon]